MIRQYTMEEVRERFLDHVRELTRYWSELPGKSNEERCSGVAFSIMVLLDGGTCLPGFIVHPNPHPEDKVFLMGRNQRYYPDADFPKYVMENDIAGELHERFYHPNGLERPEK